MKEQQKIYIDFLQKLKNNLLQIKSIDINSFKIDSKIEELENLELLIPVVGAFSAGKSSLLNSFIGKKYLNVAVTPETSLATELRYSVSEYIEAIDINNNIQRFNIEESDIIKSNAHNFKYLRYYIESYVLREISPLVLVDMPGFESPLDLHNRAILDYIDRGVYFIVLQSVEDGNITKSIIRELEKIERCGRKFSMFLSKVNLKPYSEVLEIKELVEEQLEDYFSSSQSEVTLINENGGENLKAIIKRLDPNNIVKDLYNSEFKDLFTSISQTVNSAITALGRDKKENEAVLRDLEDSILSLEKERDNMIREVEVRYSNRSVNSIIEDVGKSLSHSVDELASAYKSGGQSSMSLVINEIVQNTLSHSVHNAITDITNNIVDSFSIQLSSIDKALSNITITSTNLKSLGDSISKVATSATDSVGSTIAKLTSSRVSQILAPVLGIYLIRVINPIVGIIVSILPGIIGILAGGSVQSKEEREYQEIRNSILSRVIPQIKMELQEKIPPVLKEQVSGIIDTISENFKEKIDQKVNAIENTQKEKEEENINIEETIKNYTTILENMMTLANNTLYQD